MLDREDNHDIIMTRVIIKIGIDWIVEIEGHHLEVEISTGRIIGEDHIMSIIIEMTLEETTLEKCKITEVKILEVDIEGIIKENNFGRGRSRSRDSQYSGNFSRNDRSSSSRSRSGLRNSTNRDRIRCFKYREYDHFAKDYPNSQTEKEPKQI